ncbi:MAG: hypothetical protein Q4G71_11080 [Pseudomonadota bacterium]|nr:hypothetical protein [Pseudomonadota bacterium]
MSAGKHFEPRRWLRLARAQGAEQARALGFFLLGVGVVHALLAGAAIAASEGRALDVSAQSVVFTAGLLFSGYLYAHRVLAPLHQRETALVYLMRPASVLEKWLLLAVTLLVVYPLAYTLVFAVVYAPAGALAYRVALADALSRQPAGSLPHWSEYVLYLPWLSRALTPEARVDGLWFIVYAAMQGYLATTLAYFGQRAAFKTLVLGLALFFITLLVLVLTLGDGPQVLLAWLDDDAHLTAAQTALTLVFWLGVPALLWLAALAALRERDLR